MVTFLFIFENVKKAWRKMDANRELSKIPYFYVFSALTFILRIKGNKYFAAGQYIDFHICIHAVFLQYVNFIFRFSKRSFLYHRLCHRLWCSDPYILATHDVTELSFSSYLYIRSQRNKNDRFLTRSFLPNWTNDFSNKPLKTFVLINWKSGFFQTKFWKICLLFFWTSDCIERTSLKTNEIYEN